MNELLERLGREGARYVLIGGQAMRLSGLPRHTLDWDLYIPPHDPDNCARINRALGDELDVPVEPLGPRGEHFVQTYQTRWGVVQFHLGGPGLPPFDEALARAVVRRTEDGVAVRCLCDEDLEASKVAAGRPQDAQDIEFLRAKRQAEKGR